MHEARAPASGSIWYLLASLDAGSFTQECVSGGYRGVGADKPPLPFATHEDFYCRSACAAANLDTFVLASLQGAIPTSLLQ